MPHINENSDCAGSAFTSSPWIGPGRVGLSPVKSCQLNRSIQTLLKLSTKWVKTRPQLPLPNVLSGTFDSTPQEQTQATSAT